MYFTDITNPELQYFHGLNVKNISLSLTEILSSDLFIVETIITDSIYRIYPLFYCKEITSSNNDDKILENKCIIANKNTEETYYDFVSDDDEFIRLIKLTGYKQINDALNMQEFNALVYRLKQNYPFQEEIQIKNSTVHGKYADYLFNLESTTIVDNGILITNETLTNIGTITLINPRFRNSTYTIKMKVYSISDVNVCTDASTDNITVTPLTITLQYGTPVNIPFETLNLDHVIGFDATVNIVHDQHIIKVNESLSLSSNISNLTIGETAILTATYLDETQVPMPNEEIRFYDGETLLGSSNTNEYGVATFNFTPSVSGNHNITCKNPNDLTSNTVNLIVSKKIPVLALSASRRGAGLDIIDIEASIKYEGVGISGVTLQVLDSSDNVIVSTLTNSDGEISELVRSYAGYTLRAYYAGDATYNSAYSSPVTVNPAYTKCSITEVNGKTILSNHDADTATLRVQLLDSNDNPVAASGEPVQFWTSQDSHYPSVVGDAFAISREYGSVMSVQVGDNVSYLKLSDAGLSVFDSGTAVVAVAGDIVDVRFQDNLLMYTDVYDNTHYEDLSEYDFDFSSVFSASGTYVFHNLIDIVNTDATGKADKLYNSMGVGDIEFKAKVGTFSSVTYAIEDCLYYNTDEVSRTTTQGSTIYDNNLSQALPTNCEISFDVWSNNSSSSGEHRYFLLPKSQFSSGTTQPTYGLFFDAVAGANCKFGKRDNNSTVGIGSVFSMTMSAEHTVKFVKTGNLIEFYLDDSLKTSSTESWIDNYSDYCFSMIRWSTSGTSKIKNVKIKPL